MAHLIEDHDGAPLPDELQFEGPLWRQVYDLCRSYGHDALESVERTEEAMIAIAPIVWRES